MFHLLQALKSLHDHRIIHRDLKCANVFLSGDRQRAILGDMNVSKIMKDMFAQTQTGTPYYASPEVWRCERYDIKTDIWSLGCVIFELCNFKQPFQAPDIDGLFIQVQQRKIQSFDSTYSEQLQKIIGDCLSIDAAQRPSAKDLLQNPIFDQLKEGFKVEMEQMRKKQRIKKHYFNSIKTKKDYKKVKKPSEEIHLYLTPKVAKVIEMGSPRGYLLQTIPGDIGFESIARKLPASRYSLSLERQGGESVDFDGFADDSMLGFYPIKTNMAMAKQLFRKKNLGKKLGKKKNTGNQFICQKRTIYKAKIKKVNKIKDEKICKKKKNFKLFLTNKMCSNTNSLSLIKTMNKKLKEDSKKMVNKSSFMKKKINTSRNIKKVNLSKRKKISNILSKVSLSNLKSISVQKLVHPKLENENFTKESKYFQSKRGLDNKSKVGTYSISKLMQKAKKSNSLKATNLKKKFTKSSKQNKKHECSLSRNLKKKSSKFNKLLSKKTKKISAPKMMSLQTLKIIDKEKSRIPKLNKNNLDTSNMFRYNNGGKKKIKRKKKVFGLSTSLVYSLKNTKRFCFKKKLENDLSTGQRPTNKRFINSKICSNTSLKKKFKLNRIKPSKDKNSLLESKKFRLINFLESNDSQ